MAMRMMVIRWDNDDTVDIVTNFDIKAKYTIVDLPLCPHRGMVQQTMAFRLSFYGNQPPFPLVLLVFQHEPITRPVPLSNADVLFCTVLPNAHRNRHSSRLYLQRKSKYRIRLLPLLPRTLSTLPRYEYFQTVHSVYLEIHISQGLCRKVFRANPLSKHLWASFPPRNGSV